MSILISLEAMPNRIRALAEVVASENQLSRNDLARRVVPGVEIHDQINNLLRESIRLGVVFDEKISKTLRLSPDISKKQISNHDQFLAFCRAKLLPSKDDESNGNEAFARALAWFLTRPIGPRLASGGEFQVQLLKDLDGDDIYELTNSSRSSMLMYWAQALGFAEWVNFNGTDYCNPDPTRAMAAAFTMVLEKKHQTPVADTFDKLAREIPVFETGWIRNEVEARLRTPRDPKYLSQSSSLALSRLELRGTIKLDRLADAPALLMVGLDKEDRVVSHISLVKV